MPAYADIADLAQFMIVEEVDLPTDATRMLNRVSTLLDTLTEDAIAATDYADLAKELACTQVEYWIESGISFGITAVPDSLSSGTYTLSGGMKIVSPLVYSRLVRQGLIKRGVRMV